MSSWLLIFVISDQPPTYKLDSAMDTEGKKYNRYCNNQKYSNDNIYNVYSNIYSDIYNVYSDKWVYKIYISKMGHI